MDDTDLRAAPLLSESVGTLEAPTDPATSPKGGIRLPRLSSRRQDTNGGPAHARAWPPRLVAGVILLGALTLFALIAPLLGDPNHQDLVHGLSKDGLPIGFGNGTYPLGTDTLGRNLLPRLAFGVRTSLIIALIANATSLAVSLTIALMAGFFRGPIESLLMRVTDAFLALPGLPVALFLAALIPGGVPRVIIIATVLFWAWAARLFYGEVLRLRHRAFVESAEAAGASSFRVMFRHILPHLWPIVLTLAPLNAANAVLFESGLSFVGAGIDPPTASLGRTISEYQDAFSYAPHLLIEPALLILLVTMAFLLIGDGLKERKPELARTSWLAK